MSVSDLLSPLPKSWANLNVNSINIGGGSTGAPFNITETTPSTITGDVGTFTGQLLFSTTNTMGANYTLVGPQVISGDGHTTVKMYASNAPDSSSGLLMDGNAKITTFEPGTTITLSPNSIPSLITSENGISLRTTGGTATPLNYYEEYVAPISFSGPWASPMTRNINLTRIGRMVTLKIDSIFQIGAVAAGITTPAGSIPTRFLPPVTTDSNRLGVLIPVFDKSVTCVGSLLLRGDGSLFILVQNNAGPFPILFNTFSGLGNNGFDNVSFSYSV